MAAQPLGQLFRLLIGHQAKVQLGLGIGRQHRLVAFSPVASPNPGDVGRGATGQGFFQLQAMHVTQEMRDAQLSLELFFRQRRSLKRRQLRRGELAHLIIPTLNQDVTCRIANRAQSLHQPPSRVSHDGRARRMQVGRRTAGGQLDIEYPLEPQDDRRDVIVVQPAELPNAAVASQASALGTNELAQVPATRLLFALDDPLDRAGQLPRGLQPSFHRLEPRDDVRLVVRGPAGVEHPIADLRRPGIALPQLQRLRRLNVIMIIEYKRLVAAALQLTVDHRRPGFQLKELSMQPHPFHHRPDQLGALAQAQILSRDARLTAEPLQLGYGLLRMIVEIAHDALRQHTRIGLLEV